MELTFAAARVGFQIILLGCFGSVILRLLGILQLNALTNVWLASASVVISYHLFLYPYLFDPTRVFPTVHILDFRVLFPITDLPRGDAALLWAKKHPGADAVRIRTGRMTTSLMPLSPQALRDVLHTHQNDFQKPLGGRNYLSRVLGYGLILAEGEVHARQRKSLTDPFRSQNLRALHGLIESKTASMLQRMAEEVQKGGSCEINSWASKVTLDIIGPSLMSAEFDSLHVEKQPIHEAFTEITTASAGQTNLFALSLILPKRLVSAIPCETNRMIERNIGRVRQFCHESLKGRATKTKETTTSSDYIEILSALSKDPAVTNEEIVDQMITFLGAGHETTAVAISWAVHLLTLPENYKYQQLIREEVQAVSSDKPSFLTSLESLPWLNAVIEETFRLFPPVTNTVRIAVRDTIVAGTRVPKDTMIYLFPWAVNRNPDYWPDADRFVPERWLTNLESGGKRFSKSNGATSNFCDITFLHGNRSCIGQDFARLELRCVLGMMLSRFTLSRLPGDDLTVRPTGSITIKPGGGLHVKLE